MALPTKTALNASVKAVYDVLAHRKTRPGNRHAVGRLNSISSTLINCFTPDATDVIIDVGESITVAFTAAGVVGLALGGRQAVAGDIFSTGNAIDFSTGSLLTANPGSLATGDVYEVLSATTVAFLAVAADTVNQTGEETSDFVSIGS